MKMKVREFITLDRDIDVYDNVTEEIGICCCCPVILTKEGEEYFSEILDYNIEVYDDVAVIDVDGEEGEWQKKMNRAKEFFYAAAGYCTINEFDTWFTV